MQINLKNRMNKWEFSWKEMKVALQHNWVNDSWSISWGSGDIEFCISYLLILAYVNGILFASLQIRNHLFYAHIHSLQFSYLIEMKMIRRGKIMSHKMKTYHFNKMCWPQVLSELFQVTSLQHRIYFKKRERSMEIHLQTN